MDKTVLIHEEAVCVSYALENQPISQNIPLSYKQVSTLGAPPMFRVV
jgi:hypothetical protein